MAFYASNQIAEQFVHLEEVELISTHVTDLIPNPGMVKKFRKGGSHELNRRGNGAGSIGPGRYADPLLHGRRRREVDQSQ